MTVMVGPNAGSFDDFVTQNKAGEKMMVATVTAESSGTMCALPAHFITMTKSVGALNLVLEQSLIVNAGTGYAVTYVHDGSAPADPAVEKTISGLCPAQLNADAPGALPPGWTSSAGSPFHMSGIWMNPSAPGMSMNLLSMPFDKPVTDLANYSPEDFFKNPNNTAGAPVMKVDSATSGTLCTLPARFYSIHMTTSGVQMLMQQEAMVINGTLYVLNYARLATQADAPSAIASLKTLCPHA
ncbi:MAG: hypothetical protein GIW97_04335 [Candidatus Eremiobacteraeota bacterium]|nr:hypothetical protein [Candidatus Eremiobacteraeota bacterium]